MQTVQMTIDKPLLKEVDLTVQQLHTSRSAFMREALRDAVRKYRIKCMEEQHRRSYEIHPPDDMSEWEDELAWGDEYAPR